MLTNLMKYSNFQFYNSKLYIKSRVGLSKSLHNYQMKFIINIICAAIITILETASRNADRKFNKPYSSFIR